MEPVGGVGRPSAFSDRPLECRTVDERPGNDAADPRPLLQRQLEKAVETMQIGVTITDTEGRIVYINRAHRWFLVEADLGDGVKVREGFKF